MTSAPLRIAFAGTPEFALPALDAVRASEHELVVVATQPDRPAGRRRRLQASPVKQAAEAAGLPVIQPERLIRGELDAAAGPAGLDLLVVVAFGQLLPASVLDGARLGAINVHASLLPRWRGAAPIARALLAGDAETGVSVMTMTPALDAGPVLHQSRCAIGADATAASLHDRLATLGGEALTAVLADPVDYAAAARPQDPAEVTHAALLTRAEGCVDWSRSAIELERAVRGLQPWPWAWVDLDDGPLRLQAATVRADLHAAAPGTVLWTGHDGIDVATGAGVLRLLQVQPAGGRPMSAGAYANARRLTGCRLVRR